MSIEDFAFKFSFEYFVTGNLNLEICIEIEMFKKILKRRLYESKTMNQTMNKVVNIKRNRFHQ